MLPLLSKPQFARFAAGVVFLFGIGLGSWLNAADEPALPPIVANVLKGHAELVYAVAFTADGKYVITASFDRTLKVWEVASGKEVKTFAGPQGHQNLVLSVAISPNGQMVASGGSDNQAKIWDFPASAPLRDFAHTDAVNAVALSADGTKLAGAGKDGSIKLWNTADGKQLFDMKGHVGPVTGVSFSANGQMLASSGADKTVRFWNPANGQLTATVGAHSAPTTAVIVHPNNAAAYSAAEDGTLKFWQVPTPAPRALPAHADAVTVVALSADGNQVLTASADKTVRISNFANGQQIRAQAGPGAAVASAALAANGLSAAGAADGRLHLWAADGKELAQMPAHAGAVTGVAFHPQSTQLLSAGADGLLKLWSLPPVAARALPHPDAVRAIVATADGKRFFTGSNDKILRSWNAANLGAAERQYAGHTGPVTAIAISANGQLLASGGADETIRFWNQTNGQQTASIGAHSGPLTSLAINPNGQQVLSASEDGTLKIWQAAVAAPKLFAHPDQVTSAALSPDGAKLVTGCTDKQARVWVLATGASERALGGFTLAVTCVCYSADGTQIATGSADKSVIVWNAADGKEVKKIAGLPAAVQSVAISPDKKLIAAGLADNSLRLLDIAEGKEIKNLAGHAGPVTGVAYTPKGDLLISASADKTVRAWDSAGAEKLKLEHSAAVQSLAMSKDGTRIAAGGTDKSIKVWIVADGKPAATITTPAEVRSLGFSADGSRLVAGGSDNRARIYTLDGALSEFFPHEGPLAASFLHPDGKQVITASADKTAKVWASALLWRTNHAGPVRQATYSPKGDLVVSAGDDKTIKLWNAADGKLVKSITAHDGAVIAIGINADGTRIASTGADKTIRLWDPAAKEDKPLSSIVMTAAATAITLSPNGQRVAVSVAADKQTLVRVFDLASGKELLAFPEHTAAVHALSFLADNRTLASASADKTARLSDVGVLSVLDAHAGGVAGAAFHSNGTQALSGGADKTVKLWDLATGKMLKPFGPLPDTITAVAFSRDFTQIGAAAGKTVKVWNVADGKELLSLAHPADVTSLSFNGDKTRIVTGAADNLARVWDVATAKELQVFPHGGAVRSVVFHPNNTMIVAASADKTTNIHTISAQRVIAASAQPIRALALVASGSHVLTASDDKLVKLWNVGNGANERTFEGAGGAVHAVTVSKNNVLVATGGAEGIARIYTLADGKLIGSFKAPGPIRGLAFSPNNQLLLTAGEDKSIIAWNVVYNPGQPLPADFGKEVQRYANAAAVVDVVFAADNSTFYSASADKTAKAWKVASDTPKSLAHPNLVDAVGFSPDGTMLATGGHDGSIRFWDVAKAAQIREIKAHVTPMPAPIYCLAWTADSKQILSGSFDQSIKLWDATSAAMVREFKGYKEKTFEKGHRDGVFCVAISPDGKQIASGSSDRGIKIWNLADGNVLREFVNPKLKQELMQPPQAHPGWVYSLRFTTDGKYLVSVGGAPRNQGYLAVWNVADGKLLYGEELPLGTLYSVAISPDGKLLAVGAGKAGQETNSSYILKMPDVMK
jgi:WD40 repeat protein